MKELTAGERLALVTSIAMQKCSSTAQAMIESPGFAVVYPAYLRMLHGCIRAAVPLLETTHERAKSMASDDQACALLADYLDEHIEEERGHEEWVLQDLDSLGVDRKTAAALPPLAEVAAMVGAQYYWVLHFHPTVIMGYLAVLEGYPPQPSMIDRMIERTGFQPNAFRTLKLHAHADIGHGQEVFRTLDSMLLSPALVEAITVNALQTVELQIDILLKLLSSCEQPHGANISPVPASVQH